MRASTLAGKVLSSLLFLCSTRHLLFNRLEGAPMDTFESRTAQPDAGTGLLDPGGRSGEAQRRSSPRQLGDVEPLRVYVIEDSPVIRENLIAALEELAPIVVVGAADNEASASDWLQAHPQDCDLVTVDIFLKGGSGLGVLKSMHDTHGHRQVVVLSNYATPDMRRRCIELGADRVFDKSSDIEALLAFCEDLASARH